MKEGRETERGGKGERRKRQKDRDRETEFGR